MSETAKTEIVGPASCYYISQRLRLHYVDWGNPEAPPLILVHGGRDHARSWDQVARALRDRFHVVAPDLRGHGDSAWAVGSNYTMVEFVYDLAQLVDVVSSDTVHPRRPFLRWRKSPASTRPSFPSASDGW